MGDQVKTFKDEAQLNEEEATHLFTLHESENDFEIRPLQQAAHAHDRLWMVIRSLRPHGHRIQKNDIIKVGRVKFKVREFRTPTESFNIETDGEYEVFKEQINVPSVPEADRNEMCRFCWLNEYTDKNPKVCTCKCEGSVKYIHYECLRAWLQTKQ